METKKFEEKKVGSSIEPPREKSYSSASGQFIHSGSHMMKPYFKGKLASICTGIVPECSICTGIVPECGIAIPKCKTN